MQTPVQKALLLEYFTLLWNVIGCIVVIISAFKSSSVSLLGFGIDSVIEIFASLVVVWQLKAINRNKEAAAMRLIGIAFLLLAFYLIIQSILAKVHHSLVHPSLTAIMWLLITAVVMLLLAYGKKRVGAVINNPIVLKEAKVTVVDGLLAVFVLVGLLITKYIGWWWADIATSLVLAAYSIKEGLQAL
jgi:divalent metal cation (Fe/Co/Zn/Cd) transporter